MKVRKEWAIPSGVGIISFTLGACIGYAYSQSKGTREVIKVVTRIKDDVEAETIERDYRHKEALHEFKEDFQETILVAKGVVHQLRHEGESLTQHRVAQLTSTEIEKAKSDVRTSEEVDLIKEVQAQGQTKFNLFENLETSWDYAVELPLRTPDKPYIIHREEFFADEKGNSQSSLTYYAGDDVLCDEQDTPVFDYKRVVGMLEFGKGSQDISVTYVRNEKLEAEWEIILDRGYFQTEVLGEEIEHGYEMRDLKHSLHKFKEDD